MLEENGRMDFRNKTTFPYPSFGEVKPKSMDAYIKKYELEYVGMGKCKCSPCKTD